MGDPSLNLLTVLRVMARMDGKTVDVETVAKRASLPAFSVRRYLARLVSAGFCDAEREPREGRAPGRLLYRYRTDWITARGPASRHK